MSVQHDKKTFQRNHHQQIITADKHNTSTSSTTSRVGLRSCLRGGIEIEEAESKIKEMENFVFKLHFRLVFFATYYKVYDHANVMSHL